MFHTLKLLNQHFMIYQFLAGPVPFNLPVFLLHELSHKRMALTEDCSNPKWYSPLPTLPLLKSHPFKVLLSLRTISRWIPPVAWQLPAGCRAGKRKRRRRSCEPVWRSCWLAWSSSPQSSWCGPGGLAGSVGGETWWAPVGSVDLPQHWALQIRSILWQFLTLTACCSSEKTKGQEVTLSHLLCLPHSMAVLLFIRATEPRCYWSIHT